MPVRYQLPCSCGQQHPVEPRMAGQTLSCACGKTLTVPTLRGIQQLQPLAEGPQKAAPLWDLRKGVIFAGILVMGFSLALAGTIYYYGAVKGKQDLDAHTRELISGQIETMSWEQLRQGLHLYQMAGHSSDEQHRRFLMSVTYSALGVTALGLIISLSGAMFVRPASAR